MKFIFQNVTFNCFVMEDGVWFYGNDIARLLQYKKPGNAVTDHTFKSDRKRIKYKAFLDLGKANECSELWSGNDYSDKILINESGLYCLIFGSKLPAAEEFKTWVTKVVLPSIRTNGGYILNQEYLPEAERRSLESSVQSLAKKVEALTTQRDRARFRWHACVDERNELKVQKKRLLSKNRGLKRSIARLSEEANDSIDILTKLSQDLKNSELKLSIAMDQINGKILAKPDTTKDYGPITYRVESNGLVRFI